MAPLPCEAWGMRNVIIVTVNAADRRWPNRGHQVLASIR
jgi:hypothetical protein